MTTIPQDKLPHFFDYQDKVEHFFAYLILAFFLMLSLHFQKKNMHISKKSFLFTIIFLLIYATIDELHQIYVPGRYCDFIDWLADMSGGIFGVVLSYYFVKVSNIDIRN
ncbi:MAG: VanZ family protein [Melioribacter sp.]|nr:VanZ family protein [Melioribacter sp.]